MKLKQKLAAVLASAMVLSAVPVITIAGSTNSLTKAVMVVGEKESFDTASTAPQLKITLNDYNQDSSEDEVFYLKLTNATWNRLSDDKTNADYQKLKDGEGEWKSSDDKITVKVTSDTELEVTVQAGHTSENPVVRIPLLTKVKTGEAKVEIKAGNSSVDEGTYIYATTSKECGVVTAGDTNTFYTTGTIADLTISESKIGAFKTTDGTKKEVEITLDGDEFNFVNPEKITAAFEYGFSKATDKQKDALEVSVKPGDKQVLVVKLPNTITSSAKGQITLSGIQVKSTVKAPELGNLTVSVSGAVESKNDLVVAKIADYGHAIEVKEVTEMNAGQQDTIEFVLKENVEDSLAAERYIDFKLDKGYFAEEGKDDEDSLKALKSVVSKVELNDKTALEIVDTIVEDEKIVGFTVVSKNTADIDEINVKAKITANLGVEGEVKVTASGRAMGNEEVSAVVAKVAQRMTITSEAAVVKVGLTNQKAGKLTVTETKAGMLESGKAIEIILPTQNGMTFADEPVVKVISGDAQIGTVELQDIKEEGKVVAKKVVVKVKRASKAASTIEISDFAITTDRTVPQGAFDVKVSGNALTTVKDDSIEVKDFIVVGTANTEDLTASNGLQKGTSTFVIGEAKYTINGKEVQMDAKSYVQNPGYTMIPVRYVAEAFGVQASDILFSKGTATIFAGTRTVQLTSGSNIAIVNGVKIEMGTKVVIKNGRTYAPVGEVARLLGISTQWDNTTKTATFTNK